MPAPPPDSPPPTVSVVVPVSDGGSAFARALAAIGLLAPRPHEVLVVEDGPQSDRYDYPPSVTVLRTPSRRGPGAARNAGAAAATGEVLFFVDADVLVAPDAVERVQAALSDRAVTAVFGSYDRHPGAPGLVSQFKNLAHRFVHQQASEEAHTFWGACGAIRRDRFAALGGFDERYREPSVEDIELGMRITRTGGRVRLLKTLEVTHLKCWTLRTLVVTDVFRRAIPWSRLLLAERQLPDALNVNRRARVAALLTGLLVLCLAASLAAPEALGAAAATALALAAVDWRFWRYLARERGWGFALRAMPLQWLYYAYSSAAFLWVFVREGRRSPAPSAVDARASCE